MLKFILCLIAKVAMSIAVMGAGTTSFFTMYQPKLPEKLMK